MEFDSTISSRDDIKNFNSSINNELSSYFVLIIQLYKDSEYKHEIIT